MKDNAWHDLLSTSIWSTYKYSRNMYVALAAWSSRNTTEKVIRLCRNPLAVSPDHFLPHAVHVLSYVVALDAGARHRE